MNTKKMKRMIEKLSRSKVDKLLPVGYTTRTSRGYDGKKTCMIYGGDRMIAANSSWRLVYNDFTKSRNSSQ